jgi:O-antigen/teichoic acid export membrane protein
MLCVAVAGQDLVRVVLGPNWTAAGPVVQVLAWVGLHQSLARLNSSVLQAVNRTGDLLRYALVSVTTSVAAFVVGVSFGALLTIPCLAWRARPVFDDAMSMLPVRLRARLRAPAWARPAA